MKKLHPTQQKLLDLLKNNIEDPLTVRELQDELDISSTSVVAHHITQLEKKGYLKRNPNNPKDYQILSDSPEKLISYINLYGLAHCGPKGSVLDGDPEDRIPISSRLVPFPVSEAFMVKAKGDSMEPNIKNGDLIIVRKADSADSGSIVLCVNDGEAIIKKFQKETGRIILNSLNSKYSPFLAADDFRIEGEVRGVISSL
ncbi:MAG: transcriptional repressor LexA [Candidatus Dojkabacteria bacterium]|jgi:repressor LexA|nr:transcriptional repressor LexA [Candidatus Dojkabacteria bacterium]